MFLVGNLLYLFTKVIMVVLEAGPASFHTILLGSFRQELFCQIFPKVFNKNF